MQERGREIQQHSEVKKLGRPWPSIFRSNGV